MKCDFSCCIYNKNDACILSDIRINGFGMCEECILVSIPQEELGTRKQYQLEQIEKESQAMDEPKAEVIYNADGR